MFDLHCHSNFSDGFHTPQALLEKAQEAQLRLFALTDHDTVEGVKVLQNIASIDTVKIIAGIELSVRWKKKDIHILGLGVDISDPFLTSLIIKQKDARYARAVQIADRLEELGITSVLKKAQDIAGHSHLGRPHFAQVLLQEQKVSDLQAAFKRFLGRGKPAYVETSWVDLEGAIEAINKANGLAVIAHPLKYKLTRTKLIALSTQFKAAGGAGIEVISGDTSRQDARAIADLANSLELYASSGSDFHGDKISSVKLGRQEQLPLHCNPIWKQWVSLS